MASPEVIENACMIVGSGGLRDLKMANEFVLCQDFWERIGSVRIFFHHTSPVSTRLWESARLPSSTTFRFFKSPQDCMPASCANLILTGISLHRRTACSWMCSSKGCSNTMGIAFGPSSMK